MTPPDPSPIIDLIDAFRRSKAMFTAVRLGVFDRLERGPEKLETLAADLPANADALERLLDACVGLGLLAKLTDHRYANTAVSSAYLCRSSPQALTGYVLYSDEVLFRMWANLEDAVREGSHRWRQTFGSDGPLFDQFFSNPEKMRTFLLGMHGFGVLSSPRVVAAFDLSRFHRWSTWVERRVTWPWLRASAIPTCAPCCSICRQSSNSRASRCGFRRPQVESS